MHDYQGIIPKLRIFEREGIGFPIQNEFFIGGGGIYSLFFCNAHCFFILLEYLFSKNTNLDANILSNVAP